MLFKLSKYGISGKLLAWLKAFLTNRKQFVVVDNCRSESCYVKSGVPQGTVLGPVLFIVYINDMIEVVKSCEIALFADDAKIYDVLNYNESKSNALQADLCSIFKWSKTWQLTVAILKCSVLCFGKFGDACAYSLGDALLNNVSEVNDLGFLISSNGKFTSHYKKIVKKSLQVAANIFRVFKTKDKFFLMKMFNTYIRPIVEYGTQIWSPYLLKDIDSIEYVLRSYTKRIPEVRNLSYRERLTTLNINSLEYRRLIADLNLGFKIMKNQIDLNMDGFFSYANYSGVRSHDLKLKVNYPKTEVIKSFFTYRFINLWNKLPQRVVSAPNIRKFNKELLNVDFTENLRGRGVR